MTSVFDPKRSLEQRRQAVTNLFDFVVRGGIADTTRTPAEVIDEGPKRTLYRYVPTDAAPHGSPVLLVPPLGASAECFDLRRDNSLAEHLVASGRPTYLVDYGEIGLSDKELGLEHWIAEVLPLAIGKVSEDSGGQPVHLVGWCMGGLFAVVTAAAFDELPIKSVAMVASPFDFSKNPMTAPLRAIGKLTGGSVVASGLKALGGLPAQVVGTAFKATSLMTYVKKPMTLFKHRDDRDFLAQVEAVDGLMNSMLAYPGRALVQAYTRLFQRNELAEGKVQGLTRVIDLADVRIPVMNIAGSTDVLVPVDVAHHVGGLLPNAPVMRLEVAPGGHLGVLTGRSAPTTTWAMIDDFLDAQ